MVYAFVEPPSHADDWLNEWFPHRQPLIRAIRADLGAPSPLEQDLPAKSFFGRIVEQALNLTTTDHPPRIRPLDCFPHPRARHLLAMAGYQPPAADPAAPFDRWERSGQPPCTRRLFTAAIRLAQADELLRAWGVRRPDAADGARQIFQNHPKDFTRPDAVQLWPAFHSLWTTHTRGFHAALRSYGPATAQLPLLDGRRHADFLLGTTVLELKTGLLDQDRYVDDLIKQVLGYTLLAIHNGHTVDHVAVYATRYRRLLRYSVAEYMGRLHGSSIDPSEAGTGFAAQVLRDQP